MPQADRRTRWQLVFDVIREPMLLLLLVATALYVTFGDLAEAGALGVSVLVIISITLVQERRTERALYALREMASPRARVLRDGEWRNVLARELVPGDVVHVGEGDRVPADVVLRAGTPLTVDESLLTGESVPVMRTPDVGADGLGRPGEPGAAVFAGTLVGSGNATAHVVRTGATTEMGRIGAALTRVEIARAPLQHEVANVVRRLAVIAVALSLLLVAIHVAARHGWLEASLAGITLAMSLLPEELPLVLTVFLALGAWRMTKHRVLVRRAAAIETLGAVTVLCVDKTGTLTVNRMAIRYIVTSESHEVDPNASELPESAHEPVEYGLLACPRQTTDAMDRAFAQLAEQTLGTTEHVHPKWEWVREYPLSPGLLAVTHVWRDDSQRTVVATKGAPEAIIDLCHLNANTADLWRGRAEAMAARGLRVLGVARAVHRGGVMPTHPHDYAFEIVGLVGLADPLRSETAETVAICHAAGVRVVMITGDHPVTALAIAREAGLRCDEALSGMELAALGDAELAERMRQVDVIARATPDHKLRIIEALRSNGEVVGMTGDGVNDAPALKAADVGIAMGRGTDVAREAAALVILDDSLAAIAAAIGTGRTIYDNLRKVASFLLSVHIPIAGLALLPPLFGWPLMLAPVHVVLLELVIDPTCAIVFEMEPAAADVMRRRPRGRGEHLFKASRVAFAVAIGVAGLAGPIAVLAWARVANSADAVMRTLGFVSLIGAVLALVVASRGGFPRRGSSERNSPALWMMAAVVAVVATTVVVQPLRSLFGFAAVGVLWLVGAGFVGAALVLGGAVFRSAWAREAGSPPSGLPPGIP
jgi:Ca2+-transporting ATPase